jgi:g-D-glutamyl-meso-diaminopimelate peptidase
MRKIYIVPMLNPDGVEYRLHGVGEDNPIKERILAYNGGSDFSKWNANARGVDLNHNYDAYFEEYKTFEKEKGITGGKTKYSGEYAESEPETAALASFIRYNSEEIEGVLTLHTQGEEIYCKSKGKTPPRAEHLSCVISRLTGYVPATVEGESAMGGLTDWFIKEYNKPSFTLECGRGENPLPLSQMMDIYSKLKELLFTFPILF